MTTVVSLRSGEPYDIFCGRPGPYGNPFSHLAADCCTAEYRALSRYDAVRKHSEWARSQPDLVSRIKRELRDKVLACACDPTQIKRGMCHTVTLAKIADEGRRFS